MTTKTYPSNQKSTKGKGQITEELIIQIGVCSKVDIGHTIETNSQDHLIEVDHSMGKI